MCVLNKKNNKKKKNQFWRMQGKKTKKNAILFLFCLFCFAKCGKMIIVTLH